VHHNNAIIIIAMTIIAIITGESASALSATPGGQLDS
jgi:hypothetical protein